MGMTIDQELAEISDLALKIQGDYLTILKAEKIAMLEELQSEIDGEAWTRECMDASDERIVEMESVNKIIQQKIDALKGDKK